MCCMVCLAPTELWLAFLSRTIKRRMPENGPKSPVNKCPTMSHLWDFNVFLSFPMSKSFPSCQAATSAAAHAPAPAGPGYWSGPPDRVRPRSLRNRPRVPGVILAIDGEQYLSWSMHANLPKEAQKVQYVSISFNFYIHSSRILFQFVVLGVRIAIFEKWLVVAKKNWTFGEWIEWTKKHVLNFHRTKDNI